jgi:hypothetical protein
MTETRWGPSPIAATEGPRYGGASTEAEGPRYGNRPLRRRRKLLVMSQAGSSSQLFEEVVALPVGYRA